MIGVAVGLVLIVVFIGWRRSRARRKAATSGLASVLDIRLPYSGPKWKVPDRWL